MLLQKRKRLAVLMCLVIIVMSGCKSNHLTTSFNTDYLKVNSTASVDMVLNLYIVSPDKIKQINDLEFKGEGIDNLSYEIVNDTFKELNKSYRGLYTYIFSIVFHPKVEGESTIINEISFIANGKRIFSKLKTPVKHNFVDEMKGEDIMPIQIPSEFFSAVINKDQSNYEYSYEIRNQLTINKFQFDDFIIPKNMTIKINGEETKIEKVYSTKLKKGDTITFCTQIGSNDSKEYYITTVDSVITNWTINYTLEKDKSIHKISNVITFFGIGNFDDAKKYIDTYYYNEIK